MDIYKAIIKVLSGNFLSQILTGCLGLYFISSLSPTSYTNYAVFQSSIFLVLGLLVTPFNRIIVVSENNKLLDCLYFFQLILLIPLSMFIYFYLQKDMIFSCLFIIASVFLLKYEFKKALLQKELKFREFSNAILVRALLFVLFSLCLVELTLFDMLNDYYKIAFSALLSWYVTLLIIRKRDYPNQRLPKLEDLYYVKKEYGLIFLYFILSALFSQLDFIFLRFLSYDNELGIYAVAFQYYLFLNLVMNSLKQVLLPHISKYKDLKFYDLTIKLVPIYALFTLGVIFLILSSELWMDLVQGSKYVGVDYVFTVLAISSVFSMVFSPSSEILQAKRNYSFMLVIIIFSLLINATLNFYMVEKYGAVGVSISTLVSFIFLNISFALRCHKKCY